jgi:hypothetical protein
MILKPAVPKVPPEMDHRRMKPLFVEYVRVPVQHFVSSGRLIELGKARENKDAMHRTIGFGRRK